MRILLDECVHAGVREEFTGCSVKTVTEAGWRNAKDRPLLEFAQQKFDVFVTIDRKIEHQNVIARLDLGIVLARVASNELAYFRPIFGALLEAARDVRPGQVITVISLKLRPG